MSEERIPINEFRAKTAEVLRAVEETQTAYVITNRGVPVAEIVPYGTAIRRRGKPILGIYAAEGAWVSEEGVTSQEYLNQRRAERLAEQQARAKRTDGSSVR